MKLFQLILISTFFINFIVLIQFNDALSLHRKFTSDSDWFKVAEANDGENFFTYITNSYKVDFLQFRIDRDDETRIINDLYLNVTSLKPAKFGIFFNNFVAADSTTDNKGRVGYTPIYFATCGAPTPYFSLSSNNSYTSDIIVTVTVRDEIKLCDFQD